MNRYEGIQTMMKEIGKSGCFFFCLLSIAEEAGEKKIDLIDTVKLALERRIIRDDYYVEDSIALLNLLTEKKWHRRIVKELPNIIEENEYTVVKLINPYGGYHFKRRGFDTLINSVSTQQNNVKEYYIYSYSE